VLTLLLLLHIVVCFILILVVLLQTGKGADLAGAFGMAGSQTAFGPRGATSFLSRMTTWSAAIFMITSLSLYILESRRAGSAIREPAEVAAPAPSPEAPGTPDAGSAPPADAPGGQSTGDAESSSPQP